MVIAGGMEAAVAHTGSMVGLWEGPADAPAMAAMAAAWTAALKVDD